MRGEPAIREPAKRRRRAAGPAEPVGGVEAARLFERLFGGRKRILLAVSGGGDSTALLVLAAEWAQGGRKPELLVATVDHGLRPEAKAEIAAVKALSTQLDLSFARLPALLKDRSSKIEETARDARYAALMRHAANIGADAVATAHTLDDQAETVLMRLAAGSGPAGLKAMSEASERDSLLILRPFLGLPKARLLATLGQRGLSFAEDAMNADPRFARARLRGGQAALAREGLTPERLGALAFRMARAEAALEAATDAAFAAHVLREDSRWTIAAGAAALPDEIKLRLLGRVVAGAGGGPLRLERLERLADQIVTRSSGAGTLAGAKIRWSADGRIVAEPEPPRGRRGAGADPGL